MENENAQGNVAGDDRSSDECCRRRDGRRMVALIVVGTPGNLAEAKAVPQIGKAKQVFAALFDKLPTKAAEAK
jgi:hypothetical protein